jgi:ferric enterobactin receptor
MKSGKKETCLSVIKANKLISCFSLLLLLSTLFLDAQPGSKIFVNTPVSEALSQVARSFNVKVAFDAGKLSSLIINREVKGNTAEEMIADLLHGTGFDYRFRYNRYLIVPGDGTGDDPMYGICEIIGSVTDRETGEQLPYASVILDKQNMIASASENGIFCLKHVAGNPVHMMVSYIGYKPLDTTITWNDRSMNLDIRLQRQVHLLDTIVVKGDRMEMVDLRNDVDFATTIDPVKLIDLPMLAETDVFRTLQLLPGISYTENSTGLSIRGGSSDQNLVLFDGQTLYNLSHYYGVISALNPNVIKDLQVYKGGYDSRFGERVSGIVDITGKSGNQSAPLVYGDINLLSCNLTAELPLGKKVTLIGAVRRSYSDIYSTQFANGLFDRNLSWFKGDSSNIVTQTKPSFYFYDYNAKLTWKRSNLETFYFSFYGGKDSYNNSYSGISHLNSFSSADINKWSNYGVSASWLKQWNESLFTNIQAGTSGYENNSSNSTTINVTHSQPGDHQYLPDTVNTFNSANSNKLRDLYLSVRNTLNLSDIHQLNFGLLIRENNIYYHKDAEAEYVYDNSDQTGWTTSAYLLDRINLSDRLTIKPGFRLSYFNGTGLFFLEPRFSANYRFSDHFSARFATGRYYQFINQVLAQQETGYNKNFWVLADNTTHPEVESNHLISGFTFEKGNFMFDAEGYYKNYSGLQEYVFISPFLKYGSFPDYFHQQPPANGSQRPSYFITGSGRAYGVDLMMKFKANRYTGWLSYSYGRSIQNFNDINKGVDIPGVNDQPHQASLTNMLSFGKWNFATISVFSSGKPYIDFTKSDASNSNVERVYKRLPDYYKTDFSVNYNFGIKKFKLKTGITLLNVFNTQNYFDINTRKFDFSNTTFSETTLVQSQSRSVNFFLHFVF